MQNIEGWKPTKFVRTPEGLRASRDPREVGLSSRFVADIVAALLQAAIPATCWGRLLDLGCGKAPLMETYRPHVESVVRADWPSGAHGMASVDLVCDINRSLPFAAASFDSVLLTDVIEHVHAPQHLLCEISHILAPGGALLGTVPFLYWLHEQPHDYFRYTEHALRRMAEQAGLVIERLEPYGGGTDVVCDLLAKLVVDLHWRIGPSMASAVQGFGAWLRRSRWVAAQRQRWQEMPLGYVFVFRKPGTCAG